MEKVCKACGVSKPVAEYTPQPLGRLGVTARCRVCIRAEQRAKRKANPGYGVPDPERRRAANAAWRKANRGKLRDYMRAWGAANRERLYAAKKAWRHTNAERVREVEGARRAANRERCRAASAKWRNGNREKERARCREKQKANPEQGAADQARRRARKLATAVEKVRLADIIRRDGLACYICGFQTDPKAAPQARNRAVLEHVIPLAGGGTHTADNLRCACFPCNTAKGANTPESVREMFT